ncbi:MAG: hypothetical protein ACLR4Z_15280 [Butyricicoccaceae bacterium]
MVAIIGDGSLSGGEALEAARPCGRTGRQPDHPRQRQRYVHRGESWRSVSRTCARCARQAARHECNLFRAMGLDYRSVADGNDTAFAYRGI